MNSSTSLPSWMGASKTGQTLRVPRKKGSRVNTLGAESETEEEKLEGEFGFMQLDYEKYFDDTSKLTDF